MAIHPTLSPGPNQGHLTPQQTVEITAWSEQAVESLSLTSSPIPYRTATPLTIPLDDEPTRPNDTTVPRNSRTARVSAPATTTATTTVYRRTEPIRRDSLKRRESLLKGKEGSRRRQRWENDRLLNNPWAQPPSASDWQVQPTHTRYNTVPYYLASLWDSHYAAKEQARHQSKRKNLRTSLNKKQNLDLGSDDENSNLHHISKELRSKLKHARAARGLLQELEEDIRLFVQEWIEKESGSDQMEQNESSELEEKKEQDDEEEVVFAGRLSVEKHPETSSKRTRTEHVEKRMVFESSVEDRAAGFGRWLVHSLASYYGLRTWSVTVGNPPRREAYVGIDQLPRALKSVIQNRKADIKPDVLLPRPLWVGAFAHNNSPDELTILCADSEAIRQELFPQGCLFINCVSVMAHQLQPNVRNHPDDLSQTFNQLSLATGSTPSSPCLSPSQSPYQQSNKNFLQNDPYANSFQQQQRVPRRTPSSTSLRDERRGSLPSLQKRLSISSLRSGQNSNNPSASRPSLSRKSSLQFLSSPGGNMRAISPLVETPPPSTPTAKEQPTAASIASEHFAREIELHQSTELNSRTVVIIQDACYGHRYSRPRTSKAGLDLIVERPERMRASVLGLSTAYIRMGNRWGDNDFAPHPDLDLKLLPVPPFQIRKSSRRMPLNSPAVTHVHGTKWMDELRIMCDAAEARLALNGKELVRPNSAGRDGGDSSSKLHEGDLYLCPESLNAFEGALGGVCDAVDSIFTSPSTRRAFVCIRPPGHHCSSNYPSGFCWLNNVHVGIAYAAMTHGLTHAAILDFDLHHGDGSQAIAWEQNQKASMAGKNAASYRKTSIGYFSLHDINSYPCEGGDEAKVRNASVCIDDAHGQSIWNVHLEPWKTTQEFWQLYNAKYSILIEKARKFLRTHTQMLANSPHPVQPRAAIFLSAGFDASEWEGAGMQRHKVNVPTDFYARFTADVVRLSQEEGLGTDGRIISVLEGGYSDRALASGVLSHMSGLSDTRGNGIGVTDQEGNRLASEMFSRLGLTDDNRQHPGADLSEEPVAFDTMWWALPLLEELEDLVRPPPPAPTRKGRDRPPTFFAPTQASAAKVVSPTQERRSSIFSQRFDEDFGPPPLPEVDWATAAFEFSKLLIPSDRQTTSCQHADLKIESSRQRRDVNLTASTAVKQRPRDGMQLRERKQKAQVPVSNPKTRGSRASSISNRRTTIASVNDLPDPMMSHDTEDAYSIKVPPRRASRRVSTSSTVAPTTRETPTKTIPQRTRPTTTRTTSRDSKTAPSRAGGSIPPREPAPDSATTSMKASTASRTRPTTPAVRSSPRKPQRPTPPLPAQQMSPGNHDVNNLVAGVKKLSIKLKVPSPEENAIREAKAQEERKRTAPKVARKQSRSIGVTSTKTNPAKISSHETSAGETPPADPDRIRQQASPKSDNDAMVYNAGIHQSSTGYPGGIEHNAISSSEPGMIHPLEPSDSNIGIEIPVEYAPETTTSSMMMDGLGEQYGAVQTQDFDREHRMSMLSPPLTPNSQQGSTNPQITVKPPPPTSAPHNLPVFTSTSVIPFAPQGD
ncbi:hypothetical protein FQN57_006555 [Myotisia sp. PD_48]|nr:hypothetical protein FQN57_006555 [Myotisia sp. PD_48]